MFSQSSTIISLLLLKDAIKKLIAILWSPYEFTKFFGLIFLFCPNIFMPSSYSSYFTFKAFNPSAIAWSLSDSFTRSSEAPFMLVSPFAKDAAIENIGISSIMLGIISSGTSTPTNSDENTSKSPTSSLLFFLINNIYICAHFL